MMGWYGTASSAGIGAVSFIGALISLIVLVDLILLGVWLWKQIQKR